MLINLGSEIQVLGLLCTVDLFPVPPQSASPKQSQRIQSAPPTQTTFESPSQQRMDSKPHSFTFLPSHSYGMTSSMGSPMVESPHSIPGFIPPSHTASDIVHHVGGFPITESSKITQALVGATFVQPSSVEFQGKKSIMFVFAVSLSHDLSLQTLKSSAGSCCQDRRDLYPTI